MSNTPIIAVGDIRVPENVRALDPEHVKALEGSIALQGMLVPLVVRPATGEGGQNERRYELVAGFHRLAAAHELGLDEVPAVIRSGEHEASDRAVENIARRQLSADEEARAVKRMLEQGLSEDGAARALGWPKARVTARIKLLELPERAQQLIGTGVVPLSALETLRSVGAASSQLLDTLLDYLADDDGWAAARLDSSPGWVLSEALRAHGGTTFAGYLNTLSPREVEQLKLGKRAEQQLAEAEQLHRALERYAYGPPAIRFCEHDVDEARAAGVLLELEGSEPIIVDRALYREQAKRAIARTVEELQKKTAAAAEERKRSKSARDRPADPVAERRREHGRRVRELQEQAHGANLDLWRALAGGLAAVDPQSIDVARFFVYALLGPDLSAGAYGQAGERVRQLALTGIRLTVAEFRSDVTKKRKDGSPGKLRIDYGDPAKPDAAVKWLWRFIDGAKTAGELYGRALVVIGAEEHASRLVVPQAQRSVPLRYGAHKDLAAKALKKLAGPHIPQTLKQLEKAIERAEREYQEAEEKIIAAEVPDNAAQADRADLAPAAELTGEAAEAEGRSS